MDKWVDGWMGGWMDGWMEADINNRLSCVLLLWSLCLWSCDKASSTLQLHVLTVGSVLIVKRLR